MNSDIDLLILDYIHGTLTDNEEDELMTWVASSGQNEAYFTKTIAYLELANSAHVNKKYNADIGWRKLLRKINPHGKSHGMLGEFFKIAAVFVFAFILGYSVFQFIPGNGPRSLSADFIVTEVPYGSKSVVTLPDGSRVWINAGSKIKYLPDFNENSRIVSLEGEAYFDIVTNEKKPFYVEASGIKVKATGTRFNVRAYRDEEFIEATLEEGIISVNRSEMTDEKELILHPNQKLTVYKDQAYVQLGTTIEEEKQKPHEPGFSSVPLKIKKVELKSDVKTDIYTSWKNEEWIIYKERFTVLAKKLEKRYDVKIQIEDLSVNDFSYSGTLKDENLKEVLEVISITSPINYTLDNKNVKVWYNPDFNKN